MNFERGKDIKESLKIGAVKQVQKEIEEMKGLFLTTDDMYVGLEQNPFTGNPQEKRILKGGQKRMYETTIAVVLENDGTITILKNRWGEQGNWEVKDLFPLIKKWKKVYDKFLDTGDYEIPKRK